MITARLRCVPVLLAATSLWVGSVLAAAPVASAAPVALPASFSATDLAGPLPAALARPASSSPYVAGAAAALLAPAAPVTATVAPTRDGAARVGWVAAPSPGAGTAVDAFWVQTYLADGTYLGEQVAAPTVTAVQVTGLVPGNDYLFGVLAESSGSFSPYRFSPSTTAVGYTGTPGTTVGPYPVPPVGVGPGGLDPVLGDSGYYTKTYEHATSAQVAAAQTAALQAAAAPSGVLGEEAWQTYYGLPDAGQGQRLQENVSNGNLLLTSTDSTPVQAHGQLSYTLRRTYNSLDTHSVVTGPGSIGAGWRLNLGEEAGDAQSLGLVGGALEIPSGQDLHPGAVTLVDRDGTRHRFTPKPTQSSITVDSPTLAKQLGQLAYVLCNSLGTIADHCLLPYVAPGPAQTALLCIDQSYQAPAGVHLGLWRYLSVNVPTTSSTCPTDPAALAGATVVGYAAERPDRLHTVYSSTGELLSLSDRAGVELRDVYDLAAGPGQPLGRLRYVYEPRSCPGYTRASATDPGTMPATCRAFRLTYASTLPGSGLSGSTVTVTDPAGRPTVYTLSGTNPQVLTRVTNPDGSTLDYTYEGVAGTGTTGPDSCGGVAGQMCSASDATGHRTTFTYAAGSLQGAAGAAGTTAGRVAGPLASVTDRRGTRYTVATAPATAGTVTSPGTPGAASVTWGAPGDSAAHVDHYNLIDSSGRVGEFAEGTETSSARDTTWQWDTSAVPCNAPGTVDNNLCASSRVQVTTAAGSPPSQTTSYSYNDVGQALRIARDAGSGQQPLVTSNAYAEQYVNGADGTLRQAQDDAFARDPAPTTNSTLANDALFVISDQTATLTPRGNQQSDATTAHDYQTDYTYDQGNQGLVSTVDAPSPAGGRSSTSYTYDTFGQRTSMRTPNGGTYGYSYYADTGTGAGTDLSGTTPAGGWLRAVTDPAGHFVAYGYDSAGNVARTWDRNATAGHQPAEFPGTLTSPASPAFTEVLHADPGPTRDLTAEQEQTALADPWRWVWSSRDQLGNRSRTTHDRNGNPLVLTSARGVQAATPTSAPTTYDTTLAYDAGDLLTSTLAPAEAAANGASTDSPTGYGYDAFGNRTSTTDPLGKVTTVGYDPVDRPTVSTWSRGPYDATTAPANCRPSTSADTGFAAGLTLCSSSVAYDGLDQKIAVNDAAGTTTRMSYDAVGRMTGTSTPRNNNGITATRTATVYDADDHAVDVCSAREFTEGSGSCTPASVYATHTTYNPSGAPTSTSWHRDAATVLSSRTGYDADGNPVASTDPNGHTTTTSYDLLDRPTSVTGPRSPTMRLTKLLGYDPVGNRTSVRTPVTGPDDGTGPSTTYRTTAYGYDADNRITDSVTGADNVNAAAAGLPGADGGSNVRSRTVYDADGQQVGAYGPRAFTASTTNPDPRFLTRSDIDADGRTTATYTPRYDTADPAFTDPTGPPSTDCPPASTPAGTPAAVTVPASMPGLPGYPATVGVCVTRTGYDALGQPTVTTWPTAGGAQPGQTPRQSTTTYTDDHLAASSTGPSPTGTGTATTRTRYDAVGQPTTVTDANGNASTTAYTADHLPASSTAPPYSRNNGDGTSTQVTHTTSTGYDADGQPVARTDALGQVSRTAYTADGLTASSTNTGGGVTSYGYDRTGNTTSVLSPSGNAKDQTNPGGIPTQNTYTDDDLLMATLSAPGVDATGNPVRHQVAWTYDQGGRKVKADHNTTDLAGTTVTANGQGGAQLFAYYPDGRLQTETGRGNVSSPETITSRYDPDGNTLTATDSTGGGSTITSSYYLDGLARSVDDGRGGVTRNGFDGAGKALTVWQSSPSAAPQTSRYTYNDADLPVRQTSDANTGTGGTGTTGSPFSWAYDTAGRAMTSTTPEGQTTLSTFNPDDTLSDQTATRAGTQISKWSYTYDNLSRQLTADGTQLRPGSSTAMPLPQRQTFTYDTTGRLVTNDDMTGHHTSSYDADGNRLTYSTPPGSGNVATTSVSHYNADDSIRDTTSGANGEQPAKSMYGPSGVLKADACTSYTFDGFDRMTASDANTTGTECAKRPAYASTKYKYDALDRQRWNGQTTVGTSTDATGTTSRTSSNTGTSMSYDGHSSAVSTQTTDSTPTRRYTLDPGGAQTAMTWTDTAGQTQTQHLGRDGDGSVTTITGASTATGTPTASSGVVCATRQNPWGMPQTKTPTGAGTKTGDGVGTSPHPCPSTATDGTPSTSSDLFYQGERRDNGTGNYQLGTRTYDPAKTAFLSPDTYRTADPTSDLALGTDPLTNNRYNYVNGDPVNSSDPTGHCADCDGTDGKSAQQTQAIQDHRTNTQHANQAAASKSCRTYGECNPVADARALTRPAAPPAPAPKPKPTHWYDGVGGALKNAGEHAVNTTAGGLTGSLDGIVSTATGGF